MGSVCLAHPFHEAVSTDTYRSCWNLALLSPGASSCTAGPEGSIDSAPVKWCALSHQERAKCDEWSVSSNGQIECESAESTEDCIDKIVVRLSCLSRACS